MVATARPGGREDELWFAMHDTLLRRTGEPPQRLSIAGGGLLPNSTHGMPLPRELPSARP
jgi:hypothetical protein